MGFPSAGKGSSFTPGALCKQLSRKDAQCQPRTLPQVLCSASAKNYKHALAALQEWVATPTSPLLVQGAAIAYPSYPLS